MGRLQDFQSVTPSTSNDKLLIVQSQDQGLATLDTVGQKIATDTTHSGLTTASKKLVGALNELNSGKVNKTTLANLITLASKSGAIASFSTDIADKLFSCYANIQAVQSGSGTPALDNVRSISGWNVCNFTQTGKNIFDNVYPSIATTVKYRQIKVGNGTYTFSTNCPLNTGNAASLFAFGGYATSGGSTSINGFWNGQTRTVTTTDGYITIGYRNDSGVDPRNYGVQIEVGSTATAYEKFGKTTPILFNQTIYEDNKPIIINTNDTGYTAVMSGFAVKANQNYTFSCEQLTDLTSAERNSLLVVFESGQATIYESSSTNYHLKRGKHQLSFTPTSDTKIEIRIWGHTLSSQTVYDQFRLETPQTIYGAVLNVLSGRLKVTHDKIVLDGTQELFSTDWQPKTNSVGWIYKYSVTNNKLEPSSVIPNILCDKYPTQPYGSLYSQDVVGVGVYNTTYAGLFVRVADTSLTTASAINAWLANNPLTIVYELAEPKIIQLTPTEVQTLVGQNNIFEDCGDIDLKYLETIGNMIA